MRVLLDDIARTLRTDNVSLPASEDQEVLTGATLTSESDELQSHRHSAPQPRGQVRESMSFELSKLSLEQPSNPQIGDVPVRKHVPDTPYASVKTIPPQQSGTIQRQMV